MIFGTVARYVSRTADNGEAYWEDKSPEGYQQGDLDENATFGSHNPEMLLPGDWPEGTTIVVIQPAE